MAIMSPDKRRPQSDRVGEVSEKRVERVIRRLPGVVHVERSRKYGEKDRNGVDITFQMMDPDGRVETHELQVKSSEYGRSVHLRRENRRHIPAVNGGYYYDENGVKRRVPDWGIEADVLSQVRRRTQ